MNLKTKLFVANLRSTFKQLLIYSETNKTIAHLKIVFADFTRWALPDHCLVSHKKKIASHILCSTLLCPVSMSVEAYGISPFQQHADAGRSLFCSIRGYCREFMLACHNRINLRIVNQYNDLIYTQLLFLGVGLTQCIRIWH